jgi:murein DD-endopeptidase MepM/ murein hydrolase activator NlpD
MLFYCSAHTERQPFLFLERLCLTAALLLATAATALPPVAAAAPTTAPGVRLSAATVETGGMLVVELDCRGTSLTAPDLRLTFQGRRIALFPHPARTQGVYAGLVAVPLEANPGKTALNLAWGKAPGERSLDVAAIEITEGRYGEEALRVDPRHVSPSGSDLARIRREQAELARIYAAGSASRQWRGAFDLPVPGELSSPYGTRRVFNGELRSHHSGVDFRAKTGEPVRSPNAGTVRLAKDLFYSGNAVVVDHGAGVFTSYSHLSKFEVSVGQAVHKGQILGRAGATGRASGPHLHWGVKVNSVSVNPLPFVRVIGGLDGG